MGKHIHLCWIHVNVWQNQYSKNKLINRQKKKESNIVSTALPPAFPLLSASGTDVTGGVKAVISKLELTYKEGKAKTLTETLALMLLRQKPMLGTAYLWTPFYRRKINPSCLSCRSWVFSHLQLNTLLTEKQPKRNSKTEAYTHMHTEPQKDYLKKTRCFSCLRFRRKCTS